MENKKYQVFVSSTYVDLIDARKKIIETVLSLYHFPVGMEMFSADDSEQWEIIRETIDASDYYVIIIGHKYGTMSSENVSYTEKEYDYAKSLNIPVLAFIRNRDVGTKAHERESNPQNEQRLNNFIEKAKANKMCDFWESIDDLATKVAIALPKVMRRNPRVGWSRGDNSVSKEISEELAELSQENRKLREKVREYESQIQVEKPILKLFFSDDIHLNYLPSVMTQEYIKELSMDDIPSNVSMFVNQEMIDKYNSQLPTMKEVDEYNGQLLRYKNYSTNAIVLSPSLVNEGRRPATDIHIYIELPSFVTIINSSNEETYIIEPKINIPKSPIEMANTKGSMALFYSKMTKYMGNDHGGLLNGGIFGRPTAYNSIIQKAPLNSNHWVQRESNILILRCNKLLQSLEVIFDSISIVPTAFGEGDIKMKIISAELTEPMYLTKKITVS
ncbi:DUF4062 domain-containing protein [Citrobacter braakii]|uniref:DUF4062 domain-containing protein n=1 Tax=Citrobacter braakii TaxID=57706 RepID=UPI00290BE8B1|nr:DUF4062 domain-containing protein [Citrobacter braakii]MEB8066349.1 DUF4062 domain-containing protein [Citrobacter braakii]HEB0893850.1 DUF4062 domain-containing protein [Citrobacter braakii]